MRKSSNLILAILTLSLGLVAQGTYESPVKWEKFRIGDFKVSISFPKLPIRFEQEDICNEKRSDYFVAYAEQRVYKLTVVSRQRRPGNFVSLCRSSSKFGKPSLETRRMELSSSKGIQTGSVGGREIWQMAHGSRFETIAINEDLANNRWFELSVIGRDGFPDESRFLDSLVLSSSAGSEIAEGAAQMLGDSGVDTSIMAPPPPEPSDNSNGAAAAPFSDRSAPLVIASKVKARYTEAARRKNIQGTVTLRVTFLASGGIGDITVIKGLDYGITEQAIAAARKLAFLPQKIDGRLATTTRPVSFTFNIY